MTKKEEWLAGTRSAVPIMLGYVPVGIAYGVMARQAGLNTWQTVLMSLTVYGGASEMMAAGMVAQGAAVLTIVLTTFILNLRHIIMSTCVFNQMQGGRLPVRMLAANPLVREDAGKVAFVRGPITFCAEEKDNGANLHLLHADVEALLADPSAAKVEEFDFHAGAKGIDDKGRGEGEDVPRRMVKLEVPAWREPLPAAVAAAGEGAAEVPAFAPLYAVYAPVKREPATATLIPYFAWANRGENEMTVWLRG